MTTIRRLGSPNGLGRAARADRVQETEGDGT